MCTGKKILGGSNFSTPNFAELLKQTQYILCKAEQLTKTKKSDNIFFKKGSDMTFNSTNNPEQ